MIVRVCLPIGRPPHGIVAVRRTSDLAASASQADAVAPIDARVRATTTPVATHADPPEAPGGGDEFVSLAEYLTRRRQAPGT